MPIGYEYIVCHMEMISLIDLMGIDNTDTLIKERKNGRRKITEKFREAGYTIARGRNEILEMLESSLVCCFTNPSTPHEIFQTFVYARFS